MTEEEFRQKLIDEGYRDAHNYEIQPGTEKEMHAHDESVMSLVLKGEFTLVTENGSVTYKEGEWCENIAGTLHTEKVGPDGVTALVGTK